MTELDNIESQEPRHLKINSKYTTRIFGLASGEQCVLGYILRNMNDDNEITIAGGGRTKLVTEMHIKPQTLSKALYQMTESGLLFSEYKDVYVVNTEIISINMFNENNKNQQKIDNLK